MEDTCEDPMPLCPGSVNVVINYTTTDGEKHTQVVSIPNVPRK